MTFQSRLQRSIKQSGWHGGCVKITNIYIFDSGGSWEYHVVRVAGRRKEKGHTRMENTEATGDDLVINIYAIARVYIGIPTYLCFAFAPDLLEPREN